MANYFGYSVIDCTNPDMVGVGTGEAPDGSFRLCLAVGGRSINPHLYSNDDPTWLEANWCSLTPACAAELYTLMQMVRPHFEPLLRPHIQLGALLPAIGECDVWVHFNGTEGGAYDSLYGYGDFDRYVFSYDGEMLEPWDKRLVFGPAVIWPLAGLFWLLGLAETVEGRDAMCFCPDRILPNRIDR